VNYLDLSKTEPFSIKNSSANFKSVFWKIAVRYSVIEGRHNFSQDADVMFAANDQEEALKPQSFGQAAVVVTLDK
jgi:hypothetical protein